MCPLFFTLSDTCATLPNSAASLVTVPNSAAPTLTLSSSSAAVGVTVTSSSVRNKQPPSKRPKSSLITPENVHIEYLNQEINIVKTKITSLESQLQEKDERIQILQDNIKAMEAQRLSNLFPQYLSPNTQQTPHQNNLANSAPQPSTQ